MSFFPDHTNITIIIIEELGSNWKGNTSAYLKKQKRKKGEQIHCIIISDKSIVPLFQTIVFDNITLVLLKEQF